MHEILYTTIIPFAALVLAVAILGRWFVKAIRRGLK